MVPSGAIAGQVSLGAPVISDHSLVRYSIAAPPVAHKMTINISSIRRHISQRTKGTAYGVPALAGNERAWPVDTEMDRTAFKGRTTPAKAGTPSFSEVADF